jgi:hypothetical protein
MKARAAIGFRSHSGWAALVAVAAPSGEPTVLIRRRVVLMERGPRQPFHAAEDLPLARAEALIRRATDEAAGLAARAIAHVVAELKGAEHDTTAAGLLLASGRALPGLAEILSSHALVHAAEGEIYRDVLRGAIRGRGLRAVEVSERDLDDHAARVLGRPASEITRRVAALGKPLGPPWTQDQKRAALVAWIALAT